MSSARVAVLLISKDFLISEFIRGTEVPGILNRRGSGLTVVPMIVHPCAWRRVPWLAEIQARPRDGKALALMDEARVDAAMSELAEEIADLLEAGIETPHEERTGSPDLAAILYTAYRQKAELEALNKDATFVDEEIRDLLRQQREGPSLEAGDTLLNGRFELREPIGQGGFARVWKAYDTTTRSLVAVKVLHGQYAEDKTRRDRFFRGSRKMAKLRNLPGIVNVIEPKCQDRGHLFFVMEYLAGGDLRAAVLESRIPEDRRLELVLRLGEALASAHEHGLIHRDVKPANVLLDADGKPRLTDFDLVRAQDTTGGTRTGMLGTVLYAAPEAMRAANRATPTVDVYGLGMTAIFVVHGEDLPLEILRDAPGFVSGLEVGKAVKQVLARAVAWEPEDRQPSVETFCRELRESLSPLPRPPPSSADLFWWIETPLDGRVELWREIQAGTLWMGSPEGEGNADEQPSHQVRITRAFCMSAVPVTNAQFAAFDPKPTPHAWQGIPPDELVWHPAVKVSWHRAMEFCRWLSESFPWARGARLPTEEEWEYACRARTVTCYWSGDKEKDLARVGWYRENSDGRTHRVGEKLANAWGLYDVHGNVWEWTASPSTPDYHGFRSGREIDPSAIDPADLAFAGTSGGRVMRGGSYWSDADWARSAFRDRRNPEIENLGRGFRVLLPACPATRAS